MRRWGVWCWTRKHDCGEHGGREERGGGRPPVPPPCLWVLVTALLFDHLRACITALLAAEVGHLCLSMFAFCFPESPAPSPALMRDACSIPGSGSSPLQCSCLENPTHRGGGGQQSMGSLWTRLKRRCPPHAPLRLASRSAVGCPVLSTVRRMEEPRGGRSSFYAASFFFPPRAST